jgi:adenylate cyclase class IV
MKENLEFEIKSEINPDNDKLSKFILQLPTAVAKLSITDVYYDTQTSELYKKGIFIRVRNDNRFEIKCDTDQLLTHTKTENFKFHTPLSTSDFKEISLFLRHHIVEISSRTKSVFEAFGLIELVKIEKFRKEYSFNNLIISIDDVLGLGKLKEVQLLTLLKLKKLHRL